MITIPSNLSQTVAQAMDTLLLPKSQGGLGERCVIFYPPIPSAVLNPVLTPAGGKTLDLYPDMTNFPIQDNQNDPMEFGQDFIQVESTEVIYLTILWAPTSFNTKFFPGNRYPDGTILTRGYVTDLQKVINCDYMEIFQEQGFDHFRFKLQGEPTVPDQLTNARYFYAYWARA